MKIFTSIPSFDYDIPRNIRAYNILNLLGKYYGHEIKISCSELKDIKKRKSDFIEIKRKSKHSYLTVFIRKIISKFIYVDWLYQDYLLDFKKIFKRKETYDLIYVSIMPASGFKLIVKLSKLIDENHTKIIVDIGDPLIKNPDFKNPNKYNYFDLEKIGLRLSDHVIVTNNNTKYLYEKTYDVKNISVIPQGFDDQIFFSNNKKNKEKQILNLVYAGAIYSQLRPINPLVEAINQTSNNIRLNVYSNIPKKYKEGNVIFHTRINQNQLAKKYIDADVLLFIDNVEGIQTPGKIYELLAINKPVLFLYVFKSETYKIASNFENVIFIKNEIKLISKFLSKFELPINQSNNTEIKNHTWKERAKLFENILINI